MVGNINSPYNGLGLGQNSLGWNTSNYNNNLLQKQEVVTVNGEQGAQLYQMGANSSAILLDISGKLIWVVTTDGAGYKTINPYDVIPHKRPPSPEMDALSARLTKLEELINGLYKPAGSGSTGTGITNTSTIKSSTNSSAENDAAKQF